MQELTKTCTKCAASFPTHAIICAFCGTPLAGADITQAEPTASSRTWLRVTAALIGIGLLALVGFAVFANDSSRTSANPAQASPPPSVASQSTPLPPPPEEKPSIPEGLATASVTPWQLLKNPFMQQGKLVRLDYLRLPVIYNDRVLGYAPCDATPEVCLQIDALGLKFNRMVAANQALYDVMAKDVESGVAATKQGELIVDLADPSDQPTIGKDWIVQTEEPTKGTNEFGASITVATVQFVRFASEGDAPRVQFRGN